MKVLAATKIRSLFIYVWYAGPMEIWKKTFTKQSDFICKTVGPDFQNT